MDTSLSRIRQRVVRVSCCALAALSVLATACTPVHYYYGAQRFDSAEEVFESQRREHEALRARVRARTPIVASCRVIVPSAEVIQRDGLVGETEGDLARNVAILLHRDFAHLAKLIELRSLCSRTAILEGPGPDATPAPNEAVVLGFVLDQSTSGWNVTYAGRPHRSVPMDGGIPGRWQRESDWLGRIEAYLVESVAATPASAAPPGSVAPPAPAAPP